jgi:hypothetical protein
MKKRTKSKASKRTKGKAAAKDLRVGKRAGGAVKGGRITNVRANATIPAPGGSGAPGQIIAI